MGLYQNGLVFTEVDFLIVFLRKLAAIYIHWWNSPSRPEFEKPLFSGEVSEAAPVGTSVLVLRATDDDDNEGISSAGNTAGNRIIFSIADSDLAHQWFRVHPFSGMVTTATPLDREKRDKVTLKVKAQDATGSSAKSSFATVEITISDVNDVAPVFSAASRQNLTIPEDSPVGSEVHRVLAEDLDEGAAGSVSYSLQEDGDGSFSIDSGTGAIVLKKLLDREERSKLKLVVLASDSGVPSLASRLALSVAVQDVNDNSPVFHPRKHIVSLSRVKKSGVVFVARAEDKDEGEAGRVTYSWLDASEVPSFLSLNTSSGEVEARGNRRTFEASVRIAATDGLGRRSKEHLHLEVVKNLRRHEETQTLEVTEDDTEADREVGAVDVRGEQQGGTYDLVEGGEDGTIQVNSRTGAILGVRPLDREKKVEHHLVVSYLVGGVTSLFSIRLVVIDVNDNAPKFEDDKTDSITVDGEAPFGAPVYKVPVADPDEGNNGRLHFRLRDPDDDLSIDEGSGVIRLKSDAGRRSQRKREVEVFVTDGGAENSRLSARKKYSVDYRFGNVHTPAFNFEHQEVSVSETTPTNTRILSLPAADADRGENGEVTYRLVANGDPATAATFGVLLGGDVYLLGALDREARPGYSFTVTATDGGDPPRSSSTSVVVRVADENDNPPRFDSSGGYAFQVEENAEARMVVGRISASDPDLGRNAELSYSLGRLERTSAVGKHFRVDPDTGFITSLRRIDRERLVAEIGRDYFQVGCVHIFGG